MTRFYVVINGVNQLDLFLWDKTNFKNNEKLYIASNNLPYIKEIFSNVQKIEIFENIGTNVATFTQYDGYSSITYLGNNFSPQNGTYLEELEVTLTKVSIVEDVKRLNDQVNNIVDTSTMTLEEFKEYKIKQFSALGEQTIFNGTDVELINGVVKNFTYNLEDQSNLLNAIFIIQTLENLDISLPYHGHAEPCELYSARDILSVYFTLQFFSTHIQTIVNMKNNWVRSCQTREEVEAITFESDLPEEWRLRAEAIMGPTMQLAEQVRQKYFSGSGE